MKPLAKTRDQSP